MDGTWIYLLSGIGIVVTAAVVGWCVVCHYEKKWNLNQHNDDPKGS